MFPSKHPNRKQYELPCAIHYIEAIVEVQLIYGVVIITISCIVEFAYISAFDWSQTSTW